MGNREMWVGVVCVSLWLTCVALAAEKSKSMLLDEPLIKARKWAEAREHYGKELTGLSLSSTGKAGKDLLHLVLCYDVARYFEKMEAEDASALVEWLLSEPDFTAELLGAFVPQDDPQKAFHVLAELKAKFGERTLLKNRGLTIAHVLVWDAKKPISETFSVCDSFGYYVQNDRKMAFPVSSMPYQVALFLAAAAAAPEERAWALARYKRPKNMSAVYHEPEYDTDYLYGQPKKISQHEFTLENILKYGGVCHERAIFAANVACACGIPGIYIAGRGERGRHAWTGYVQVMKGGRYVWNLDCGRYSDDNFYAGEARDPQTQARINDYEIPMRTMACGLSADKLRASNAFLCLAEVLDGAKNTDGLKLALDQCIKNNRFNLCAWDRITRLCKEGVFDSKYADDTMDKAMKLFPDEPGFCFGVFEAMMATIPNEEFVRRKRLYQNAVKFFKERPDLTVAIGTEYGDYLLARDKKGPAFDVYHDTLRAHMDDPRLVADLALKVVDHRMEDNEGKKAVQLLTVLLAHSEKPSTSNPLARYSAWYRLASKLKEVHTKLGDEKAAAKVEAELNQFVRR